MPLGDLAAERIASRILVIRDCRVLLDEDLARLYGVETRALNQAVRRNMARFPPDFCFRVTEEEERGLKSQFVISSRGGRRRSRPMAFTEQGVAMLSSVLRSPRAIAVNIQIMRAFVELRRGAGANAEILKRLDTLEARYDGQFQQVFRAIRALIDGPDRPHRRIGFKV